MQGMKFQCLVIYGKLWQEKDTNMAVVLSKRGMVTHKATKNIILTSSS